jgi:hypothetical protein
MSISVLVDAVRALTIHTEYVSICTNTYAFISRFVSHFTTYFHAALLVDVSIALNQMRCAALRRTPSITAYEFGSPAIAWCAWHYQTEPVNPAVVSQTEFSFIYVKVMTTATLVE